MTKRRRKTKKKSKVIEKSNQEARFCGKMMAEMMGIVDFMKKFKFNSEWYFVGIDGITGKICGIDVSQLRTVNTEEEDKKLEKHLNRLMILKELEELGQIEQLEEGIEETTSIK